MLLILLAAMLWGTTGTAQSFAPVGMSAYWVGALRLLMAGLFFIALAIWVEQRTRPSSQGRLDMPRLLLCALCMAVYNLAFFAGLQRTGIGLGTAVALGSSPIWAGLLQAAWQRQWPQWVWWLGTFIGVMGGFGMALATAQSMVLSASGIALCLLSGLAYGAYAVMSQLLVRQSGLTRVNAWVFGAAALMALPCAAVLGDLPQVDTRAWAVVTYLGIVATGVAYLLFSSGLRTVSAATSVALTKFEPITAFVLSIVVVGEAPSWLSAAGLALVLLGLWLVVHSEMRQHRQSTQVQLP